MAPPSRPDDVRTIAEQTSRRLISRRLAGKTPAYQAGVCQLGSTEPLVLPGRSQQPASYGLHVLHRNSRSAQLGQAPPCTEQLRASARRSSDLFPLATGLRAIGANLSHVLPVPGRARLSGRKRRSAPIE